MAALGPIHILKGLLSSSSSTGYATPEGVAEANLQPRCPRSIAGLSAAFTGSWIILVPPIFFFYPTTQTPSSALLVPGKTVWESSRGKVGIWRSFTSLLWSPFSRYPLRGYFLFLFLSFFLSFRLWRREYSHLRASLPSPCWADSVCKPFVISESGFTRCRENPSSNLGVHYVAHSPKSPARRFLAG